MSKLSPVHWLGCGGRWCLRLLPDVLFAGAVLAFSVFWIASIHTRQPRRGTLRHDVDHIDFFSVALRPPGTAGLVARYTAELGKAVTDLPAKGVFPDTGYLDYIPNQEMTQGKKERVAAVVSLSESDLERVRDTVFKESRGNVNTDEISISQTMTAKLTGSSGLQIQELSTPEQLIRGGDPTVWNWDVTPTESGEAELYLILSVRGRSADGFPSAKDLGARIRKIKVETDPAFAFQKFFKDNLAAIVGVLSIVTTIAKVPVWRKIWNWIVSMVGRFWLMVRRSRRRPRRSKQAEKPIR